MVLILSINVHIVNAYFSLSVCEQNRKQSLYIQAFKTIDFKLSKWWVWVDSNHRPHPYQG